MKRVVSLFLVLIFIIILNINVNAKDFIIPNQDEKEYKNVDYLDDYKTFNYLELSIDSNVLKKLNNYNKIIWDKTDEEDYGSIVFESSLFIYSKAGELIHESVIEISYNISGQELSSIVITIDDKMIFITSIINDEFNHRLNNKLDINEYFSGAYIAAVSKFQISYIGNMSKFSNYLKPDLIIAMSYEDVLDEEIYINKFSNLSSCEIANECGLTDLSGNRMTSFKIIGGTYEENSNIGDYTIKIRGYNLESKCIFKKIIVHVIDTNEILIPSDFNISYKNKLEEKDILNDLNINEPYDDYLFNSDYLYCSNKKGNYKYYLTLNIDNKNILFYGYINVYDKDLPYFLKSKDILVVENNKYLTKEELLNNFIVYDDHDGIIDSSKIILDGYVYYLGGYKALNEYEINLITKDSSNNELKYNFIIKVLDVIEKIEIGRFRIPSNKDEEEIIIEEKEEEKEEIYNPKISNNDYIINAYTTHKLTPLEVQDLLISEGILNNDEIVFIESDYFLYQTPSAGNFPLKVKYENGDIVYFEIKSIEKEIIMDEEDNNKGIIIGVIIGIVIFVGLSIVIIMKVYVHVKKN